MAIETVAPAAPAAAPAPAGDATILEGAKAPPAADPKAGVEPPAKTEAEVKAAEDAKKLADEAAAKAAKEKQSAPEKYENFKLPDGMKLDDGLLEKFKGVAKDLNLTQEQAQKLVDFQTAQGTAAVESRLSEFKARQEAWRKETLASLGADSDKKLALAARARDTFASPELVKILSDTGLGDHPAVVKFFIKMGERVTEDNHVEGNRGGNEGKSAAEVMYGDSK